MPTARFVHDTHVIVEVDADGCGLFRCDAIALIDRDMIDLIATNDFRGLARLRMAVLRKNGNVPDVRYPFRRCDGSVFWAALTTRKLECDLFETLVHYESEA